MALNWKEAHDLATQEEKKIKENEVTLEKFIAKITNANSRIEGLRETHVDLTERFNKAQGIYYTTSNEIVRVEKDITYSKERKARLTKDIEEIEETLIETNKQIKLDEASLSVLNSAQEELEPELQLIKLQCKEYEDNYQNINAKYQEWQKKLGNIYC